jgi:hypothetical protein
MERGLSTVGATDALGHGAAVGTWPDAVNGGSAESVPRSKPTWTFLTNHARVLLCLAERPGARVRDVAQSVGVTERCVQQIISNLAEAGYVSRAHQGRRNSYEVHADLPLRHPAEQHQQVSALLELMRGDADSDREGQE